MSFVLSNFRSISARFRQRQEEVLGWLVKAHAQSEASLKAAGEGDPSLTEEKIQERVARFCCGPESIGHRGSALSDYSHENWNQMKLFNFSRNPKGAGIGERNELFHEVVRQAFSELYPDSEDPPDDIVHVTCTGYHSPSAAQILVDERKWSLKTLVTHAYHMGCYAAFPAVRMAAGFLSLSPEFCLDRRDKKRVDLVHTELCSFHFLPSVHTSEQLVVESLFADGFIKYSMRPNTVKSEEIPGLELVTFREEILPQSQEEMTWKLSDWGMAMNLSREVPGLIMRSVRGFLDRLFSQAQKKFEDLTSECVFAIHPGGPLILNLVEDILALRKDQVHLSRKVLYEFGNISSATLPHIWKEIVEQREIPLKTWVVSLAFGPGLTVCGGLFRKV
jgi:predicted naringenin-chalcone synthase